MKLFRGIIYVSFIVMAFSCLDDAPTDFNNPESTWNPEFSFPVGYTSLQMNEESGFDTTLFHDADTSGFPDWVDDVDVSMSYTMPFNLQEINDFSEQIVSIMFRINTYNGFPNVAKGQVYFLDVGYQVVDSMFVNGPLIMESGSLTGDGKTVNPNHDQNDVVFDQSSIDNLLTVRHILIEGAVLNISLDSALIDFYSGYSLEVQIGVQVELNMSL